MGLFDSNTDAIYVLISKVDNASYKGSLDDHLLKYMTKNYLGFYNNLLRICKEHNINNGRVNIVPFSIGEVCFKDLFIRYSYYEEKSWLQKLINMFKS